MYPRPHGEGLGRGGAGFELRPRGCYKVGPRSTRGWDALGWGGRIGHFLILPDVSLLPHCGVISRLSLPQKWAVSLEQTWVPVARDSLGATLTSTGSTCGPCRQLQCAEDGLLLPGRRAGEEAASGLSGEHPSPGSASLITEQEV